MGLERSPDQAETGVAGGGLPLSGHRSVGDDAERIFVASQWQLIRWKFVRHRLAVAGTVVIALMYTAAIFADFIAPYPPNHRTGHPFAPPQLPRFVTDEGFHLRPVVYGLKSERDPRTLQRVYVRDAAQAHPILFLVQGAPYKLFCLFETRWKLFGVPRGAAVYLMGTDRLGRDVFSRVLYGARISLSIGLVGVAISLLLGIVLGGISGYFGGVVDTLLQRMIEILRSFPTIPLWMALSAAFPERWTPIAIYFGITVILSLIGWTELARVVRGRFLSLRDEDFVVRLAWAGPARQGSSGGTCCPLFSATSLRRSRWRFPA